MFVARELDIDSYYGSFVCYVPVLLLQLKCDGGSAGCGYVVQPRAVECVNLAKAHQSDNSMAAVSG